MITKRLVTVQCVLLAGFGSIFLLPQTSKTSPAGIAMTLPSVVGTWFGDDAVVTEKERAILAKDTQFVRKDYKSPEGDQIFVSIVLSGDDMTTSIHRPERCLPAQGWQVRASAKRAIQLPDGKSFDVTRLQNAQTLETPDKRQIEVTNLNYYWFVGYDEMTASHLTRTGIDIRDRILHGQSQRWAYVTVAANVTQGIWRPERSEEQTTEMLEKFMQELAPRLQKPDGSQLF
ncbi:MAG TPA: EpsI family protein [Chthoniobacterales bacterium]|jgi:EpsI family protein|nr:EpsI family protein [Chthoniobacterales bacterium]